MTVRPNAGQSLSPQPWVVTNGVPDIEIAVNRRDCHATKAVRSGADLDGNVVERRPEPGAEGPQVSSQLDAGDAEGVDAVVDRLGRRVPLCVLPRHDGRHHSSQSKLRPHDLAVEGSAVGCGDLFGLFAQTGPADKSPYLVRGHRPGHERAVRLLRGEHGSAEPVAGGAATILYGQQVQIGRPAGDDPTRDSRRCRRWRRVGTEAVFGSQSLAGGSQVSNCHYNMVDPQGCHGGKRVNRHGASFDVRGRSTVEIW